LKRTLLGIMFLLFSVNAFAASYFFSTGADAIVPGTVDTGNHCDDCTTPIALPFSWILYGTFYDSAYVSSNGNIQFVSNNDATPFSGLPDAGFSKAIFAYWGDLDTEDQAGGQGIFTSVSGSGNSRIFNVEWRTRLCCGPGAPTNNFELRLYEGQDRFDIVYGSLTTTGQLTTVGVQKDGTDYDQFEDHTSGTLSAGLRLTAVDPPAATPEPGTFGLLAFTGGAAVLTRRLRKLVRA
jgi:hypothetical protein